MLQRRRRQWPGDLATAGRSARARVATTRRCLLRRETLLECAGPGRQQHRFCVVSEGPAASGQQAAATAVAAAGPEHSRPCNNGNSGSGAAAAAIAAAATTAAAQRHCSAAGSAEGPPPLTSSFCIRPQGASLVVDLWVLARVRRVEEVVRRGNADPLAVPHLPAIIAVDDEHVGVGLGLVPRKGGGDARELQRGKASVSMAPLRLARALAALGSGAVWVSPAAFWVFPNVRVPPSSSDSAGSLSPVWVSPSARARAGTGPVPWRAPPPVAPRECGGNTHATSADVVRAGPLPKHTGAGARLRAHQGPPYLSPLSWRRAPSQSR